MLSVPDTWGFRSPGVNHRLPQEDLRPVMGTSDSQRQANHPLPSWHLVRAYSDLLPERKHIYGALSVCPALWQPLYVFSQGGGCYPYCADEEIEAQRCYVTGLGHVHHVAEPGCQPRTV